MDERQRRLRIERMKREKARQLRRRRRQKMILKRCILAAACVAVVLLVISGVWALVKPAVGKGGKKDQSEQAVMEVEASKEESTEKAVSPTPTKEAEPSAQPEEESDAQAAESGAKAVNADAAAQRAAIATGTEVTYAVPGWQVDDTGWWYANDDGTYFTNGWQEIDGQEYYFNAEGYMQTGWAVVGNKGCYFSEEGIYEPDKESKMVALTFDDGPGDHTDELLDILEENNAKATFFMLGENVAAKADYDRERATDALIKAGFGETLASMGCGLETYLYKEYQKDGVDVSGGEAQKIAIARALYKNSPFLVMDEPTAALDPVAEAEIYAKLNEIVGDKTAVYISHRLSSCRFCDSIAVFDHGSIIQRGTHESLLQNEDGKYFALWNAQAQYYVEH